MYMIAYVYTLHIAYYILYIYVYNAMKHISISIVYWSLIHSTSMIYYYMLFTYIFHSFIRDHAWREELMFWQNGPTLASRNSEGYLSTPGIHDLWTQKKRVLWGHGELSNIQMPWQLKSHTHSSMVLSSPLSHPPGGWWERRETQDVAMVPCL